MSEEISGGKIENALKLAKLYQQVKQLKKDIKEKTSWLNADMIDWFPNDEYVADLKKDNYKNISEIVALKKILTETRSEIELLEGKLADE